MTLLLTDTIEYSEAPLSYYTGDATVNFDKVGVLWEITTHMLILYEGYLTGLFA